jgi:hypothetical protein
MQRNPYIEVCDATRLLEDPMLATKTTYTKFLKLPVKGSNYSASKRSTV